MSFSDLPSNIRHDIIHDFVGNEYKYASVSKEWLQCAASDFGKLNFSSYSMCDVDTSKPIKYSTQYVTKIWIGRCENIDWDLIYSIKSIKEVAINFSNSEKQDACNEVIMKLMLLPSIESVVLFSDVDVSKCLGQLLEKNQLRLKVLYILSEYESHRFVVENIMFPNVTRLTLFCNSRCISTQWMAKSLPSLESLTISFESSETTLFESVKLPNLTSLDLRFSDIVDDPLIIDLSTLPRIKEMHIGGEFKFVSTSNEFITRLKLIGTPESVCGILDNPFTNLKKLTIKYEYCDDEQDYILFEKCNLPNLKFLEIKAFRGNLDEFKVILIKLSSIRVLQTYETVHFIDEIANDTVEELNISRCTDDLSHILSHQFTNLKRVQLYLHEQSSDDNMKELFQCFKKLTELDLRLVLHSDLLRALPPGPYSITHLSLQRLFILSLPLLTWISHHFPYLMKLTLHWYHFRGDLPSTPLPFPNSCQLIINTPSKYRSNVEAHFNPKNYPQIKLAIYDCTCDNCYTLMSYGRDFYQEKSDISKS